MKQKDAIKLSAAIALLAAAGLIAYLTLREPKPPAAPVPAPTANAQPTPAPGTAPKQETLTIQGGSKPAEAPRGPIRAAPPTGK